MLTTDWIERILARAPAATIGLLGDLFLDRYLDIEPSLDEPSIETGLTAYQVTRVRSYPGALGTVLNNLSALGVGRLVPITIIGDDGEGYELRQALQTMPTVELAGIVSTVDRRTPTYTKPMVLDDGGPARELNRLDIKNRTPTPRLLEDRVLTILDAVWPRLDALLVLDQVSEVDCGVVTTRLRQRLAELGASEPNKFVLADSRARIHEFHNVATKPNQAEYERTTMATIDRPVFVTRGEQGIRIEPGGTIIPAFPVSGPIDIVGAGDSCSAGIACAMVAGASPELAAAFGNLVASITIQQLGTTGTATPQQIRERWQEVAANGTTRPAG